MAGYPEGHPAAMTVVAEGIEGLSPTVSVPPSHIWYYEPRSTALTPTHSYELIWTHNHKKERQRYAVEVDEETGKETVTVCRDADYAKELAYLKEKVDAGASCIITQVNTPTNHPWCKVYPEQHYEK